jgi:hypothetical protein
MIKLNLNPDRVVLGQFAWVAAFAFPLMAGAFTKGEARWYAVLAWNWSHPAVLAMAGLGVAQLLAFLMGFRPLTWLLYVVMSVVAYPIGFVLSHVLMASIYFLMITPIALVFRVIGRDVLLRKLEPGRTSYWHQRATTRHASSYFKLY